jgi:hypothetical protein
MKHINQLFLFMLLIIFTMFIVNTNYKKNVDKHVKYNDTITNDKLIDYNIKHNIEINNTNDFMKWNKQWVGRNNNTKRCYQNCQGLRTDEYLPCSETCISGDPFYKY